SKQGNSAMLSLLINKLESVSIIVKLLYQHNQTIHSDIKQLIETHLMQPTRCKQLEEEFYTALLTASSNHYIDFLLTLAPLNQPGFLKNAFDFASEKGLSNAAEKLLLKLNEPSLNLYNAAWDALKNSDITLLRAILFKKPSLASWLLENVIDPFDISHEFFTKLVALKEILRTHMAYRGFLDLSSKMHTLVCQQPSTDYLSVQFVIASFKEEVRNELYQRLSVTEKNKQLMEYYHQLLPLDLPLTTLEAIADQALEREESPLQLKEKLLKEFGSGLMQHMDKQLADMKRNVTFIGAVTKGSVVDILSKFAPLPCLSLELKEALLKLEIPQEVKEEIGALTAQDPLSAQLRERLVTLNETCNLPESIHKALLELAIPARSLPQEIVVNYLLPNIFGTGLKVAETLGKCQYNHTVKAFTIANYTLPSFFEKKRWGEWIQASMNTEMNIFRS
ncbi:MAG: hypothetical protein ACK4M7_03155, partial [Burkholderiales bacterium]